MDKDSMENHPAYDLLRIIVNFTIPILYKYALLLLKSISYTVDGYKFSNRKYASNIYKQICTHHILQINIAVHVYINYFSQ